MASLLQTESQETEDVNRDQEFSDSIFTFVGLFLVFVLIIVTVKGKLRDWLMK